MERLKHQFKIEEYIVPNENYELTENLYHGTERRIIENFYCLICLSIVNDPVKCSDCSKFYCRICIEYAILNKNRCPNCLNSPFNKDKIDLFIMNLLNESEFICPLNCGKIIRHCQQDLHKKQCPLMIRFFRCNLCKIDVGEDNEFVHKEKCEFLKTRCAGCNQEVNKMDFQIHLKDCQKQLNYCDRLKIYYEKKNDEAYKEEFIKLLSNFDSFYQNIKQITKFYN